MQKPEVWLRGPVTNIPDLLQPAAHALIQSKEEVIKYTKDFPQDLLFKKAGERASVGFHLNHLTGVLDRMLSYAQEKTLDEKQFLFLQNETKGNSSISEMVKAFEDKVDEALVYFKTISPENLTDKRFVGRKKLPSTLIGLLFHAAEHSQRHVGQLLVTISFIKS